jgi:hypothetical protein
MTVNSTYKDSPVCIGSLSVHNCTLQRGKVRYPISIQEGVVTIDPLVLGRNDTVELDPTLQDYDTNGMGNWATTTGGVWLAAYSLFNSSASFYDGGSPYDLFLFGSTGIPNAYISSNDSFLGTCNMTWTDPTLDILNAIREITFRAALAASNSSTVQIVPATDTISRTIYVSNYGYLGGALVAMILSPILIMPLFMGWWRVGRTVSLSPIEIAKAFRAPLLNGYGCNGSISSLLKEAGTREVKYGVLSISSQAATGVDQKGIDSGVKEMKVMETGEDNGESTNSLLGIADRKEVTEPETGFVYQG